MDFLANLALALAAAALIPSAGPFVPALFLSGLAGVAAVFTILSGRYRRGILTVYLAISACLVSPLLFRLQRVDLWLAALIALGCIVAAALYLRKP